MAPGDTQLAAAAADNLSALLDQHAHLYARWQSTKREEDRRAMQASWHIWITSPGSRYDDTGAPRESWPTCTPTVLSRDSGQLGDHLEYRGACLGCGWVSDHAHRLRRGGENAAVEDAHDHTHPGWRETPVVEAPPTLDSPHAHARAVSRWRERWEFLLPQGWLDRGGPIRTKRTGAGTRHVPGRAPGGGYDLAAVDGVVEQPGGQLGLF